MPPGVTLSKCPESPPPWPERAVAPGPSAGNRARSGLREGGLPGRGPIELQALGFCIRKGRQGSGLVTPGHRRSRAELGKGCSLAGHRPQLLLTLAVISVPVGLPDLWSCLQNGCLQAKPSSAQQGVLEEAENPGGI